MASDEPPPQTRSQTRVPIDAEVQLEFENFSGFIREVSANLSLGGLFVKTRYLKPVGTVVRFEFRLSDQYRLIRGTGEVVWTRWRDQPPAMPAGMGIQFLDLDAESRTLVNAIVDQHLRAGGAPFDLDAQAQLEARAEARRGGEYAAPLPAAQGSPMSADSVADWLRTEPRHGGLDVETEVEPGRAPQPPVPVTPFVPPAAEPPLEDQFAISFAEPPDLPPAAPGVPTAGAASEAPAWPPAAQSAREPVRSPAASALEAEARGTGAGSARPLDWGAAEAMAALGIEPTSPVAAPPAFATVLGDETLVPPDFPAPRIFSGGHAASEKQGSPWLLRIAVLVVVAALGGAVWWFVLGRPKPRPAAVSLVEGPSSARQATPTTPSGKTPPTAVVPAAVAQAAVTPAVVTPAAALPTASVPAAVAPAASPARAVAAPAPQPTPPKPATAAPTEVAPSSSAPGASNFDAVRRITFHSAGGETEVVLSTNGVVRAEDVEHIRLEDPEPREILKLRGVVEAFSPSKIAVNSGELRGIRVGFHEQKPRGQLHVVFDLASRDVRIVSMRADGADLRVRIGRE